MKNLRHKSRFGLILEAYCRGIGSFLKVLSKQIEAIDVLSEISISYKSSKESLFQNRVCFLICLKFCILFNLIFSKKDLYIKEKLENKQTLESISNYVNPMNRSHLLGSVEYEHKLIYFEMRAFD